MGLTIFLTTFADDLRRNTGNNNVIIDILRHNSAGSNNCPMSDSDAAGNTNMGTDQYIIFYDNWGHNMIQTCH